MRAWVWFVLGFCLTVAAGVASAGQVLWTGGSGMVVRGPDGVVRSVGMASDWTISNGTQGGADLRARHPARIGNSNVVLDATRGLSARNVARVAAKAARGSGYLIVAGLALDAYLDWDEEGEQWLAPGDSGVTYGVYSGRWGSGHISPQNPCPAEGCTYTVAVEKIQWNKQQLGSNSTVVSITVNSQTQHTIHWGDGATSLLTRTSNDGACPTGFFQDGVYCKPNARPATASEIEDVIYTELVAKGMGSELARRLIDKGYAPLPTGEVIEQDSVYVELVARGMSSDVARRLAEQGYVPDLFGGLAEPTQAGGPSTVPGETATTTTSGPAGQTTTVNTTTYNITYNQNTANVTQTTTTTTTHPDGSQTTSVETREASGGGEQPPTEKQEQRQLCDEFPNASACEELGEPEEHELAEEERDVSWEQEGSAAGSCPGDKPFFIMGSPYALSWQPVCDFASGIRPFVIGFAWLSAGIFLFGVGRAAA